MNDRQIAVFGVAGLLLAELLAAAPASAFELHLKIRKYPGFTPAPKVYFYGAQPPVVYFIQEKPAVAEFLYSPGAGCTHPPIGAGFNVNSHFKYSYNGSASSWPAEYPGSTGYGAPGYAQPAGLYGGYGKPPISPYFSAPFAGGYCPPGN